MADLPPEVAAQEGRTTEGGSHAQRAVAWFALPLLALAGEDAANEARPFEPGSAANYGCVEKERLVRDAAARWWREDDHGLVDTPRHLATSQPASGVHPRHGPAQRGLMTDRRAR